MNQNDVRYHRPKTLEGALELGREFGAAASFIAGGTDLLVLMKARRAEFSHLISLLAVPELHGITREAGGLRIGALTTLNDVARSELVKATLPALAEAARSMAGQQVRNLATLGGNFCGAVPCADLPPVCMVADAEVVLAGAEGERSVRADAFFRGPRQTVRRVGEVMVALRLPPQPAQAGSSYQRFSGRRANALAVASVAARIVLDGDLIIDARVALGAVAPMPWLAAETGRALRGHLPGPALFARAGTIAAAEASPISDVRGGDNYRRELVSVLTERALHQATTRAKGQAS